MNISGREHKASFGFSELQEVGKKLLCLANSFDTCNVYTSDRTSLNHGHDKYDLIAGLGIKQELMYEKQDLLTRLTCPGSWVFGNFEYQDILHASHVNGFLYEPMVVAYVITSTKEIVFVNNGIDSTRFEEILDAWGKFEMVNMRIQDLGLEFIADESRDEYIQKVEQVRNDITYGKYYELNYCIGFRARLDKMDLLPYFIELNEITSSPFAAYVKNKEFTLLCSSPERFLCRRGNALISQPIKGTNGRRQGLENEDQLIALRTSEKERAENVMIVDLVRNDLARVCKTGTIRVEELCEAYAFKTVNHLISTVSGELREGTTFADIMDSLFPMGSMTGAPKVEVMKHIEKYESKPRGIYSGCLGYIEPSGDFDFNVVIRSLVHREGEISYNVGSAITYDSQAEQEYEECLLKGHRLAAVLSAKGAN